MFLFQLPLVVLCWLLINQKYFSSSVSGVALAQENGFMEDDFFDDDYEEDIVDSNGEVIQDQMNQHPLSRSVTFENIYQDKPIQLFWIHHETGAEVDMGTIEPRGKLAFSSYLGHRFTAKTTDLTQRVPPFTVSK